MLRVFEPRRTWAPDPFGFRDVGVLRSDGPRHRAVHRAPRRHQAIGSLDHDVVGVAAAERALVQVVVPTRLSGKERQLWSELGELTKEPERSSDEKSFLERLKERLGGQS